MRDNKQLNSSIDKEFDNDSWLSKKEISMSTKLLVAAGGITSFGGLLPMIVENSSGLFESNSVLFFMVFTITYFVMPLLLFVVWMFISDRVTNPDVKPKKGWRNMVSYFNQLPITYRYMCLVLLHVVCIILYLTLTVGHVKSSHVSWINQITVLLVIAPILGAFTFRKREYKGIKINKRGVVALTSLIVLLVFTYIKINHQSHDNQISANDYGNVIKVNDIFTALETTEHDLGSSIRRNKLTSDIWANLPENKINSGFNFIDSYSLTYMKWLETTFLKENSMLLNNSIQFIQSNQDHLPAWKSYYLTNLESHQDYNYKSDGSLTASIGALFEKKGGKEHIASQLATNNQFSLIAFIVNVEKLISNKPLISNSYSVKPFLNDLNNILMENESYWLRTDDHVEEVLDHLKQRIGVSSVTIWNKKASNTSNALVVSDVMYDINVLLHTIKHANESVLTPMHFVQANEEKLTHYEIKPNKQVGNRVLHVFKEQLQVLDKTVNTSETNNLSLTIYQPQFNKDKNQPEIPAYVSEEIYSWIKENCNTHLTISKIRKQLDKHNALTGFNVYYSIKGKNLALALIDHQTTPFNISISEEYKSVNDPHLSTGFKHNKSCTFSHPLVFGPPAKYYRVKEKSQTYFDEVMNRINTEINDLFDGGYHTITAACFNGQTKIKNPIQAAIWLNKQNAELLSNWLKNTYIPFCKSKSQSDIQKVVADISWIWKDMRIRGLAIAVTSILVLGLCYLELMELKNVKINEIENGDYASDNSSKKKIELMENVNKKASYLLYPNSMILSICCILFVAVLGQEEIPTIDGSGALSLVNVPKINVAGAINGSSESSGNTEIKMDEIDGLRDNLKSLTQVVDSLNYNITRKYDKAIMELNFRDEIYEELSIKTKRRIDQLRPKKRQNESE
ncbi:MAG: hypothetical protein ACJAUV_001174 [Flavobacteriales bacterium]|jgi:hypothetical protein